MSNNTILKALERMGYKERMTGHGFRGLAATILDEQEYAHEHIEIAARARTSKRSERRLQSCVAPEGTHEDDAGLG
jgi:hypothetical protein